jgi:hypothetical protein
VRLDRPLRARHSSGRFWRSLPLAKSAIAAASVEPPTKASNICRSEVPSTSEATAPSLMFAPSKVFCKPVEWVVVQRYPTEVFHDPAPHHRRALAAELTEPRHRGAVLSRTAAND